LSAFQDDNHITYAGAARRSVANSNLRSGVTVRVPLWRRPARQLMCVRLVGRSWCAASLPAAVALSARGRR
jgi:hypothetical protein